MPRRRHAPDPPSILPSVWPPTRPPLPFLHYWSSTEPELHCTAPTISPTTPSSFLRCTAAERLHRMAVSSKSEHAVAAYHDRLLSSPPCRARSALRRERRPRPSIGGSSPRQASAPAKLSGESVPLPYPSPVAPRPQRAHGLTGF
jgi:hypothetical protein